MIRILPILFSVACYAAPCREISADRIRAADIAAVYLGFAAVDPGRDIAPAPVPGVRRVFRAEELAKLAGQAGIEAGDIPREICFERASQTLTAEALLPALRTAFNHPAAEIELVDFSRYRVPHGTIEFDRVALGASGFWRGRLVYAEGRSSPIWVRIRAKDASTGAAISFAPAAAPRPALIPKEVERGDKVKVEVSSGGVMLGFDATAETAGRSGDTITIKNPVNGRRMQARVADKGKVSIQK